MVGVLAGVYYSQLEENTKVADDIPHAVISETVDRQPDPASSTLVVSPGSSGVSAAVQAEAPSSTEDATGATPVEVNVTEFEKMADGILKSLPKISELQKLKGEAVHSTPEIVSRAGVEVGQIAQAIHDNTKLSDDGIRFYRECATQNGGVSSVRALCYAQLRNLETHLGREVEKDLVPEAIEKLAKNIPVEEP